MTDTPTPPLTATGGPERAREARVGPAQPSGGSETPQAGTEGRAADRGPTVDECRDADAAHWPERTWEG